MKRAKMSVAAKAKYSLKRTIFKVGWFGTAAFLVLIAGTVIFLALFALNGETNIERNDFIAATWLDAFVLVGILILFAYLFRKKKHVLMRWTRRSFIILVPMVFIAAILITTILLQYENENFAAIQQDQNSSNLAIGGAGYVEGITFDSKLLLEATNRERGGNGKTPLVLNDKLNTSAQKKCEDMVAKNYWSHNDPSGNEPWHFIAEAGYKYETASENQAYGYVKESDVVAGWLNSSSHRENLLSPTVTEVGFGVCKGDNFVNSGKQLIVVQHLAKPQASTAPTSQTFTQSAPKPSTNSSANCSSLYNTYYTIPMIGVGPKPTSTYIINYIGTDEYDYQVSLYNSKVVSYNSKWQHHKSNYLNEANKASCSTGLYTSMMDLDEARPYPVN